MLGEMIYTSGGGGMVSPEFVTAAVGAGLETITLPHAPVSILLLDNTSTQYPTAGTCRYDVVNQTFIQAPKLGTWTTFTVSGNQLTLQGDNNARNWTYDITVV